MKLPVLHSRRGGPIACCHGLRLPSVAFVIVQEGQRLVGDFSEISLAVALLTVRMLLAGWGVGWACALGPQDRFALVMVFVVRNVAVATAVAVSVLARTEFAVFATACFLNQVPILIAALGLYRMSCCSVSRAQVKGTEHEPASQILC